MKKYSKIVIGVDQSYSETGIGVTGKNSKVNLLTYKAIDFKDIPSKLRNKTEKRNHLRLRLKRLLLSCINNSDDVIIIIERVRLKSNPGQRGKDFISAAFIKAQSALIASVVDEAYKFGVKVYSVDTRSWKAQVLGSSKSNGGKKNNSGSKNKTAAIDYVMMKWGIPASELSRKLTRGKNKGKLQWNDNIPDAICISEYGHLPDGIQKLQLEE